MAIRIHWLNPAAFAPEKCAPLSAELEDDHTTLSVVFVVCCGAGGRVVNIERKLDVRLIALTLQALLFLTLPNLLDDERV
jgi:hypothetical protein